MSRVKISLQAPEGVTESLIEGTYYWPEEDGSVGTTNPNHAAILVQHGYVKTGEVSIIAPAQTKGPIDIDEMGRSQLQSALSERGLSYPDTASRDDLADIAQGWNRSRLRGAMPAGSRPVPGTLARQPIFETAAAARDAERTLQAAEGAGGETKAATVADVDFGDASYDELKGWLAAHGVGFPPNTKKDVLRKMAEDEHAAIKAKGQAKAAA